jgi:hypothetical protein
LLCVTGKVGEKIITKSAHFFYYFGENTTLELEATVSILLMGFVENDLYPHKSYFRLYCIGDLSIILQVYKIAMISHKDFQ